MDTENNKTPPGITRREFIGKVLQTSLAMALGGGALSHDLLSGQEIYNPSSQEIYTYRHKLPAGATSGYYAVVHLTDIHYDNRSISAINPATLPLAINKVIRKLAETQVKPEDTVVVCTGDWVNGVQNLDKLHKKLLATFKDENQSDIRGLDKAVELIHTIPAAAYLGTLGNHDHKNTMLPQIIETISTGGFTLIDQTPFQTYQFGEIPINFIGGPDFTEFSHWFQSSDNLMTQATILNNLNNAYYPLYLTHNPMAFDSKHSLLSSYLKKLRALCGHTHWFNFLEDSPVDYAAAILAKQALEYDSDLIAGYNLVGGNIVTIPPGLGQHPITPLRKVPAGLDFHLFGWPD